MPNPYSQTIPRELVHKRSVAEVLVTSVVENTQGWTVHAQLPRQHSFYTDVTDGQAGFHDPLFLLEAIRQGGLCVAHLYHEAPFNTIFLVRYYDLTVHDLSPLEIGPAPLDLKIDISAQRVIRREPQSPPTGLEITATALGEDLPALTFSSSFSWLPLERWAKLREGASFTPVPSLPRTSPRTVCRASLSNVTIGEPVLSEGSPLTAYAPIIVDTSHATMFDHPLDHLPGGLILEACRQLALAALARHSPYAIGPVIWTRCEFSAFVELNRESTVQIQQDAVETLLFHAEIVQSGTVCATVTLRFAAVDGASPSAGQLYNSLQA